MSCEGFMDYLGANMDPENHKDSFDEWNTTFRATNKIISSLMISFTLISVFFLQCFSKKSKERMIESSIFSFLNDLQEEEPEDSPAEFSMKIEENLPMKDIDSMKFDGRTTSHSSFEVNEIILRQKEIETAMQKETSESNESKEVYICDVNECFWTCLCQCWLELFYRKYLLKCYSNLVQRMERSFKKNIKAFCFYFLMIGAFVYHPVRDMIYFLLNLCNARFIQNNGVFGFLQVFFLIVEMVCASSALVLFLFTISFLDTQSEFLKTYMWDKSYRARMIYFHLKKALIIGFMHFLLKLAYKSVFLFKYPAYDIIETPFALAFLMFGNIFIASMINLNSSTSTVPIDQDCRLLKGHASYFAIQNHLLKKMPQARDIYSIIKKKIAKNKLQISKKSKFLTIDGASTMEDLYSQTTNMQSLFNPQKPTSIPFNPRQPTSIPFSPHQSTSIPILDIFFLEQKIRKKCLILKKDLTDELAIIEQQKFKNILRNNVKYLPTVLIILLTIDTVLTVIFTGMMFLKLRFFPEIHAICHLVHIGYTILSFFECSLLPFLIFFTIKKSNFFDESALLDIEKKKLLNFS